MVNTIDYRMCRSDRGALDLRSAALTIRLTPRHGRVAHPAREAAEFARQPDAGSEVVPPTGEFAAVGTPFRMRRILVDHITRFIRSWQGPTRFGTKTS